MTPLVKMPINTWPSLRNQFIQNWPKGAAACCFLDAQINNPKLSEIFDLEVYTPFGDMNSGIIAYSNKSGFIKLIVLPVNNTERLEEALIKTNLIDWNRNVVVPFATPDAVNCLIGISKEIGVTLNFAEEKAITHLLLNTSELFDISLPSDTHITSLRRDHIDIVDRTWMFHSERSKDFFKALMENDMTYVLYSSNDEPKAWITINEVGALTHLFCLEPFRRRGYAELVTKFACNDLLRKGRHVIAYTVDGNEKSQNLLDKLGFQLISCDCWVFIKKH